MTKRRYYRQRPGRQNKFVVAFGKNFTRYQVFYADALLVAFDGGDFAIYVGFYAKSIVKALRRLQCQRLFIAYYAAYIIRQSAICIRNISRFLKDNYFGCFI